MKQFIGKTVKLVVKLDGQNLFYKANVICVTDEHIIFRDKFDQLYGFRISDIVEVNNERRPATD